MTGTNEVLTFSPVLNQQLSNSSDPPSPRSGILKPVYSSNERVNSSPNWKSFTENGGTSSPEFNGAKKQVRDSITSVDSTFDVSTLNDRSVPVRIRCQRRLSVYLHTHVILIIVSTLAICDAICVIGQLICDILIMKEKLDYFENIDDKLTVELLDHLPCFNKSIHAKWNLHAILEVLQGTDIHGRTGCSSVSNHYLLLNTTADNQRVLMLPGGTNMTYNHRVRRALQPKVPGHEVDHGVLYELTHAFHLGSMAILSALLLETLLKVVAMGKKLKHHKLEVFDAFVVTVSWCLDVAFWEGIWAHPGSEAATLLIYLLPWRVVRIVNSFVLVIQEKEHVHLKIVKQRLRQSLKKTKEVLDKASNYRHEVKALAGLCRKLGAAESEITACSPTGKGGRRGSVQSLLERAASLTFISTMARKGSMPSLFDMIESSSDEEDRIENNDIEQDANHNLTIISAISSSTLDSGSANTDYRNVYENNAFVNDNGTRDWKTSEKEEAAEVETKSVVDRATSNDSVPPDYTVAVEATDIRTYM